MAFDEARQQAVETGAPSAQQGKEKEEEENKAYLSPVFKVRVRVAQHGQGKEVEETRRTSALCSS